MWTTIINDSKYNTEKKTQLIENVQTHDHVNVNVESIKLVKVIYWAMIWEGQNWY